MKRIGFETKWTIKGHCFLLKETIQPCFILALNKNINHILFCTAKENFQEYPFPGKVGGKTCRGHGCSQEDLFILSLLQWDDH